MQEARGRIRALTLSVPYGVAGAEGRLYRRGRLPVFAVAHAPRTSRWQEHMARVASHGQVIWPAAAAVRVA
jgi:hypothetical protein